MTKAGHNMVSKLVSNSRHQARRLAREDEAQTMVKSANNNVSKSQLSRSAPAEIGHSLAEWGCSWWRQCLIKTVQTVQAVGGGGLGR